MNTIVHPSAEAPKRRGGRPLAWVTTSTIVLLAGLSWLALPSVALADNWTSPSEIWDALKAQFDGDLAMIGAALGAIGAGLSGAGDWLMQARGGPGESMQGRKWERWQSRPERLMWA